MSDSSLSQRSSLESLRSLSPVPSIKSEPDALPPSVEGRMVWQGNELEPRQYITNLERADVEAVRAAVLFFKLLSLPRGSISKDTFPLSPDLARRLSAISDEIHHGRGVVVVRGLDSAVLNDEESVIAFAGLASYVCPERATDSYANQT